MISNFLGDVGGPERSSPIISSNELLAREGVNLQKSMNYRDDGRQLSVFLVLPSHEGEYREDWNEKKQVYVFEGHDSTTVEGGKAVDQLMVYESGKPSDNGTFYKAANFYKDGVLKEPMQIQVYEKIDLGVWFDKGIFNLVDATYEKDAEQGRKIFKFHLMPADSVLSRADQDAGRAERMIPVAKKISIWKRDRGRCAVCLSESNLHFATVDNEKVELRCTLHTVSELQKD